MMNDELKNDNVWKQIQETFDQIKRVRLVEL